MAVAVLLCTYQGGPYLGELLRSLASQTRPADAVYIQDDHSTDDTVAIAQEFCNTQQLPVFLRINQARLGSRDNFLTALEWCAHDLTASDFIAVCDQDDYWLPDKLEICAHQLAQLANQHQSPPKLLVHSATVADSELRPLRRPLWPKFRANKFVLPRSGHPWEVYPGFAMVLSAGIMQTIGSDWRERPRSIVSADRMSHDEFLEFLAFSTDGFATVAEPLVLYRQHRGNVAGAPDRSPSSRMRGVNVEGNLSYSYLADLARDRADYCRNMKHPASQLAMQYWSRVGETCSLRARLYNSSTGRLGRARIAYQLSRMGYALASGSGRPWAAFLKDLTIGILMNRSVDPGT